MAERSDLLVADECWVALAFLHREHPDRSCFAAREILQRVRQEGAQPTLRAGLQTHISLHNVANVAPNSARYRLFYRLAEGGYRLFRPGDQFDPRRTGKTKPDRSELPTRYHGILEWYETVYCGQREGSEQEDPVLLMRGVGREIWRGVDADAYVAGLRLNWTTEPQSRERAPAAALPD